MAHLIAVSLGENRKYIDQQVNAEWLANLEDEIDVESIKINGVEFSSVLTATKSIAAFVAALEENEYELESETEAYYAYAVRYWGKNPDVNTVIEGCDRRFVESAKEEALEDVKQAFADQRANDYFDNLKGTLSDEQITFLESYFDYQRYAHDIFINDYDAIYVHHDGYSMCYFFTTK